MKKTSLITFVLVFAVTASTLAQEKITPRTEFTIELSSSVLEIQPGQSSDITISLNRSKTYSKSKAVLRLSSGLPQGVTVAFEPAEGVLERSVAKIVVAEDTKPGNYKIVVNSTLQNKSKGVILNLIIKDNAGNAVTSTH